LQKYSKTFLCNEIIIRIYVYNLNFSNEITIDTPNLLQFILSNGLRLKSELKTYLNDTTNKNLEVFEENLLNCSFGFINDFNIVGLRNEIKLKYLRERRFQPNHVYLIVNISVFGLLNFLFGYILNLTLFNILSPFEKNKIILTFFK